jgi:hypothetical protein
MIMPGRICVAGIAIGVEAPCFVRVQYAEIFGISPSMIVNDGELLGEKARRTLACERLGPLVGELIGAMMYGPHTNPDGAALFRSN